VVLGLIVALAQEDLGEAAFPISSYKCALVFHLIAIVVLTL